MLPPPEPRALRLLCSAEIVKHAICGLDRRNIAAFINHSCTPNCFVQPVLSHHHNADMPRIAIFAADNLPPFTQLTWDYGEAYAKEFHGGCKCGAAACITLQLAEEAAAAAAACAGAASCAAAT